jgi:hypothetical protein
MATKLARMAAGHFPRTRPRRRGPCTAAGTALAISALAPSERPVPSCETRARRITLDSRLSCKTAQEFREGHRRALGAARIPVLRCCRVRGGPRLALSSVGKCGNSFWVPAQRRSPDLYAPGLAGGSLAHMPASFNADGLLLTGTARPAHLFGEA